MNQLLGCVALSGAPPSRTVLAKVGSAAVETPRAAIAGGFAARLGDFAVAFEGSPRLDGEPLTHDGAARLIEHYRREGAAALGRLRGPFALALCDLERSAGLLAIDRMGVHELCWAADGDVLIFGRSAATVASLTKQGPRANRQALFDFFLLHVIPAPDSAFAGVEKLLAGTYLEYSGTRVATGRYWTPSFARAPAAEVPALREQVLPAISRGIERCEPDAQTGTFLSGGLDSSTVTGLFAQRQSPARAFSVSFGVDEFDELRFAKLASERFGCEHHVYEVVPKDVVDLIPRIAAAYDDPFGNSSAAPVYCCARLAKEHGTDYLLAGDGGDEIFGGNERYVRQKVFEHYARLPALLRRAVLEPLALRLPHEEGFLPVRKFSSYVRQARIALPERFETWNLMYREGPAQVFDADFLAQIDVRHPLQRMRESWDSCPSDDLLDRMLWYDWKFTLADNDLRKVMRMCEAAGVRVAFPMIDEELVDLSLRVPSDAKIEGQELRAFYKRCVQDFLPAEIVHKKKHGFGLPFGVWLKTEKPLQDLVYGSLDAVRNRGILRRDFVDRVAAEHKSGHAGYYGYAIWDMVMLEQWLALQPASIL